MVVPPDAVKLNAVLVDVAPVLVFEINAPKVLPLPVAPVMEMSNPLPEVFAVEELVINKFSADTAVLPDMPRFNKLPLVIPVEVNDARLPVNALVVCVSVKRLPPNNDVEPRTNEFVVVLLFQFQVITLAAAFANVALAVAAPKFVRVVDVDKVVQVGTNPALNARTCPLVPVVNPLTAVPVVA